MADGSLGQTVDNALENIRNRWSLASDGVNDLRKFDIVVNLGADQKNAGSSLLYVGAGGKGEIQRMDTALLKDQQPSVSAKIVNASALSVGNIKDTQDNAARQGATVIMKNFDVIARSGESISLPFNPENPKSATAEDLPQIQAMLWNLRGDIINGAAPDFAVDNEGRVEGVTYKDNKGVQAKIEGIENALAVVDRAIALPGYQQDLRADIANQAGLFVPAQADALKSTLADTMTIGQRIEAAGNAPVTKEAFKIQ